MDYLLSNWTHPLGWLWAICGVYLAVRIVWEQRSPAATMAWMLVLCLLAPVGVVLYHFVGPRRIHRQTLRRMHSRALLASQQDLQNILVLHPDPPLWARQHSRLIQSCCDIPASSYQSLHLYQGGGAMLEAMLQDIQAAQSHIHLEYYIFEPDQTGTLLLQALQERARAGVRVRLLVDGVGCARLLGWRGRALLQATTDAGVELGIFHPTRIGRWQPLVNLRTHRKILICDGHIAYTGGINITDDENEQIYPETAFRDTHMRLHGAVVRWLQYIFLQDWVYATGRHHFEPGLLCHDDSGINAAHVVASGPDSDNQAIHHSMVHALNIAQHRILLTTPYFVPTEAACFALLNAARRGVNVQIMVPQRSDSLLVTLAAHSYYDELRAAGARIFEYTGRMLHAKTLVVDEHYSLVGTANFDNRSMLLNFEIAVALYGAEPARQLADMFVADLRHCQLVQNHTLYTSPPQRLAASFARLLSPLL